MRKVVYLGDEKSSGFTWNHFYIAGDKNVCVAFHAHLKQMDLTIVY